MLMQSTLHCWGQWQAPQGGPLWPEDYFELKSNKNLADFSKSSLSPHQLPKKNLDRGLAPGRKLSP